MAVSDIKQMVLWICRIILVAGGITWGMVALGIMLGRQLNPVSVFVGSWPAVEVTVYVLYGLAAWVLFIDWALER